MLGIFYQIIDGTNPIEAYTTLQATSADWTVCARIGAGILWALDILFHQLIILGALHLVLATNWRLNSSQPIKVLSPTHVFKSLPKPRRLPASVKHQYLSG